MATTVTYNGVVLHNVSTQLWDETVFYDQSGTDPIGVRYNLAFDAVVHVEGLSGSITAPTYTTDGQVYATGAAALRSIIRRLNQPRKPLRVVLGNDTVISVDPHEGPDTYPFFEDIDNGPKPQGVKIFRIASDKAFRIRFSIQAVVNNCTEKARISLAVNNRWTVQEAMDENHAIHRTITGSIRLTGSAASSNSIDPLAARDLAFPRLEDGFRRQMVSYVSSLDGLSLNYQLVDRQSRYAAPWPATKIAGRHKEQTMDGARFVSSAMCRLTGPPHCSVPDLVARAVQFTQFRINWSQRFDESSRNSVRILDAYIAEDVGDDPSVEVGISVERIYTDLASILAKTKNENWGKLEFPPLAGAQTPLNDGNVNSYRINWHHSPWPFGYNEHGSTRNAISSSFLRCVLQGQCGNPASLPGGEKREVSRYEQDSDRESETVVNEYDSQPELDYPDAASTWSDEHLDAMYLAVSHTNKYPFRQPMAQLPVAGPVSGNNPTCSNVRLCQVTSKRIVVVDYERYGKAPQIPPWQAHRIGNANLVPVSAVPEILPPRLTEDGDSLVYRVRCRYLYYSDRAISLTGNVPVGRLPVNNPEHALSEASLGDIFNPSLSP